MNSTQLFSHRQLLLLLGAGTGGSILVTLLFTYASAVTHSRSFIWLGFIVSVAILVLGVAASHWIKRRREKAQEQTPQTKR